MNSICFLFLLQISQELELHTWTSTVASLVEFDDIDLLIPSNGLDSSGYLLSFLKQLRTGSSRAYGGRTMAFSVSPKLTWVSFSFESSDCVFST